MAFKKGKVIKRWHLFAKMPPKKKVNTIY